jgi:hypothetical protein
MHRGLSDIPIHLILVRLQARTELECPGLRIQIDWCSLQNSNSNVPIRVDLDLETKVNDEIGTHERKHNCKELELKKECKLTGVSSGLPDKFNDKRNV